MKLRRREGEVFSLSFMDCICCGFGAILLLLVLTDVDQPVVIERARVSLNAQLLKLEEELFEIRGDSDELRRELQGRIRELRTERDRLARLQGDLTNVRGEYDASRNDAAVASIVASELVSAYQELTADMERLRAQPRRRTAPTASVGGIPVDSEYVVFVIDTSDSMAMNHWESTVEIMSETLDIYPDLKGLQVVNDQGRFMFESGAPGSWLKDSPELRQRIRTRLRTWRPYSQSNPVPGIELALRLYRERGQNLSIVVIGDEFGGNSMQEAVERIARLNVADSRPRARIHAIGFQQGAGMSAFTNIQFSALMRTVTARNGGTFVGITNEKP
ncbi:MAG: VWA domain-containing protein [Pseudomonadota bacterium]|nr:VWA domain-containing protein [Pseudomonadota bacterium]